jgi:hypothetical protein
MRHLFLGSAVLCGLIGPAGADAQFAPVAVVPDYVVTMDFRADKQKEGDTGVATQHGQWTRVDLKEGERRTTEYFSQSAGAQIRVYHTKSGEIGAADFRRGDSHAPYLRAEPRDSGERQTLPPRELLALSWWEQGAAEPADAPATPDYETVMEIAGARDGSRIRTTRYHQPWKYVEETVGSVRRSLDVSRAGLGLRFESDATGTQTRLLISKYPPISLAPPPTEPKALNRRDQVLGESCDWFDMWPGSMDAGKSECRTRDGITLKEERYSWGTTTTYTAVRLARRAVGVDEVTPPAAVLEPKNWGFD